MSRIDESAADSCSLRCESRYRSCVDSGEHESVCRMKRVPCDCRCTRS